MRVIIDALDRHASERAHHIAIIDSDGTEHAWAALRERVATVRNFVHTRTERGARVGVALPSGSDFWIAVLGIASAGRVPAVLPTPIPGLLAARLARELPMTLTLDAASMREASQTAGALVPSHETCGAILLSSGTTGSSRFVIRSSNAIDAIATTLLEEELAIREDVVGSFLPMTHAYGFEHAFLAPILAGACVRVLGAFSLDRAARALAEGATSMPLVPFTADALAERAPPCEHLRNIVVAGTTLTPAVRARVEHTFKRTLVDLYGATELGTIWLDRGRGGQLVRGVEVQFMDPDSEHVSQLEPNRTRGEIAVRSVGMLTGIIEPDGQCVAATSHGFFRTGDLGERAADGALRITGRLRLVFDVGGLKVNPLEVEQALESHPSIRYALVKPVLAGGNLQRVAAELELRDATESPTLEEIRAFLTPLLPSHALPRSATVVQQLPRTSSGKLLRNMGAVKFAPVVSRPAALVDRAAREKYTKQLFDDSARGYDHASGFAFLRSGRRYRRSMLLNGGLTHGSAHLDVGSGTGLCAALAQEIVGPTGRVVALDPSTGMLEVAKKRGVRETVVGRAESLPFENATFDFVSMSYMLRHIDDLSSAFSEALRVLRPGGRILIFELTRPERAVMRCTFDLAMQWIVPSIGVLTSGRPATFPMMRYWAETMQSAAPPARILEALHSSGFTGTRHLLQRGVFSCYRGSAPLA